MTRITTTTGGQALDQIALEAYGTRIGSLERILDANPGLAAQPAILPPGLTITLPDAPSTSTATTPVTLYD